MTTEHNNWTIHWGAYGKDKFWSDVSSGDYWLEIGKNFSTQEEAIEAARNYINALTLNVI
jgi:hypothetical protein